MQVLDCSSSFWRSVRFSRSMDGRRRTGVLRGKTGPADICGGIQWGANGPPWPGGGVLVVADLTGFTSAVYKGAAHARRRSVTPPLPIEAAASIGGKVPRAILWFLSHRGERNAPPARRPGIRYAVTFVWHTERNRTAGGVVGANLTGCASAVSERGRGCLRAFDCSSSPNRSRGFGLGNGGGGRKTLPICR